MHSIVSPLDGIRSPFGAGANVAAGPSAYAVEGFEPPLVVDSAGILNSGTEYYRANGETIAFADLFTFGRASAATYVDSSGVLQTAATGVARRNHHIWNGSAWVNEGVRIESAAATNLLHTTGTLVTQSYTTTAVAHTLSFTGTGTVTLSGASTAGPLVGTGTGENNRVSLTFTPTAASLTMTVSGTVTNAQLEIGSVRSSYIPNPAGSGTVTRAAETLTIAGALMPYSATAMSFQVQGRVSYADLNQSSSPYLFEWYSTGTNYIDLFIDADRGTGGVNARQRDTASGLDIVEDGGSSFSPGLNVPYNIATRNTSNAINLAISGSAGTADTTPTALPNLSASLFRFGTIAGGAAAVYNGTIGLFRAWDADIGDTGISEASS